MGNIFQEKKYIWSTFGPFKKRAIGAVILMIACAFTEAIGISFFLPLVEMLIQSDTSSPLSSMIKDKLSFIPDSWQLIVVVIFFFSFMLLRSIISFSNVVYIAMFIKCLRKYWFSKIFEKYTYAQYSYLTNHKQGELLNNLLMEPNRASVALNRLMDILTLVIVAIALFCVLLAASWKMTLILTVLLLVPAILTSNLSKKHSLTLGQKRLKSSQEMATIAAETIAANRQIKLFSLESHRFSLFQKSAENVTFLTMCFQIAKALPKFVGEIFVLLAIVVGLTTISLWTSYDFRSFIPIFALFGIVSQRLLTSTTAVLSNRMSLFNNFPALRLIHDLSHASYDREQLCQGQTFTVLSSDIILKNISFGYSDQKLLFHGMNLRITKGKMTALVGPSGSGKSTLADLLVGLYVPQAGQILVNGINLQGYSLETWRSKVGFVSQDTFVFNVSVRDNIIIGKPNASDDEIVQAAKKAHAHGFICELAEGYDTFVGDRGVKLSGGERQRIAIARAVIRNPELYIFDEATSALDYQSEKFIKMSIEELAKEKTILVIAHRTSTIENADVVYDLEEIKNGAMVKI